MKKLAIIGCAGIPSNYGGFETLAENLVDQLSDKYEITVFCSSKNYKREDRLKHYKNARLKYIRLNANGVQSILYDYISILRALFFADTLLILGVSGCSILPLVRLFTRKKIIVNIDGLEWHRDKWSKFARAFLRFSERMAIKYSDADVADNEAIKRYTELYYNASSKVIEYGGDHAKKCAKSRELMATYPIIQQAYCFKVARIEPENNIEMILRTFSKSEHRLVLVGNWANSEYGRSLKLKFACYTNLLLLDPIYDKNDLGSIRSNASIYIHGHEAGGTNPSLVEAMFLGLPVFAFEIAFNRETTENKASYFSSEKQLSELLKTITAKGLAKNGAAMQKIADRRYRWSIIADKYDMLFQTVACGIKQQQPKVKFSYESRMKIKTLGFYQLIDQQCYFDLIQESYD
ncbi:MAG: glycosyl transferase [Fluviicola sp.]|nr:MAG: glycosyl transferase [Fluviicola sp.]